MNAHTAPAKPVDGEVRARRYIGRHMPPKPVTRPPPAPLAERINIWLTNAEMARKNAHREMRDGNFAIAADCFHRAHSYIEIARELRALL